MSKSQDFKTRCVHEGELKDTQHKGSVSPLYMASSYAFEDVEIGQYPRYFNTPNQRGLAKKIASLEGAEAGLIFGSGMAAISTALLSHLQAGDHVVFQDDLYGGTRNFLRHEFSKYGIAYSFAKGLEIGDFEAEIKPETKGIYIETPSNPLLKIVDLKGIAEVARKHNLWTMIDNTFASPVNQNPIQHGIDVVIHSATKYLGGHSDICAGVVVSSQNHMDTVFQTAKNLGGSLSDYTVWLLERSVKTLFLRVQAQNRNAMEMALFLESQDWVEKVHYPGLENHPGYALAKQQMSGFGGMLSFVLDKEIDTSRFFNALQLVKPTMSLAGIETTALSPRLTSHALLTEEERLAQGITPQLVRFSTGIEATEDLQKDLIQAVNQAK